MTTESWKVVMVEPTGAAVDGSAFGLLHAFATKEEAEELAECLLTGDDGGWQTL